MPAQLRAAGADFAAAGKKVACGEMIIDAASSAIRVRLFSRQK